MMYNKKGNYKGESKMKFKASSEALGFQLKDVKSIGSYLARNKENMLNQNLAAHLNMLLNEKDLKIADVIRGSCLDRSYVYQIFSGEKTPSRDKLIAIAFGLHLTEEETQRMLKLSGNRELYVRDPRDTVILFAIQRNMDIFDANILLDEYDFNILGNTIK